MPEHSTCPAPQAAGEPALPPAGDTEPEPPLAEGPPAAGGDPPAPPVVSASEAGATELGDLVERMLRTSGRRLDMSTPFVDAMLPDGSRLHVVIPDITRRHMAVNIRKFVLQAHSVDELVSLGTITAPVSGSWCWPPWMVRVAKARRLAGTLLIFRASGG